MYRLIGEQVEFKYSELGRRYWRMNEYYHRDDDGPTYENAISGYCEWHKYGRFVRDNYGASADWRAG